MELRFWRFGRNAELEPTISRWLNLRRSRIGVWWIDRTPWPGGATVRKWAPSSLRKTNVNPARVEGEIRVRGTNMSRMLVPSIWPGAVRTPETKNLPSCAPRSDPSHPNRMV